MKGCLICNKQVNREYCWSSLFSLKKDVLCENCRSGLSRIRGGCLRCNKQTNERICSDCKYWMQHPKTRQLGLTNKSLYVYNEMASELMNAVKFKGDCKLLDAFKFEIKQFLLHHYPSRDYILVPTPLPVKRLNERGFNQALYMIQGFPYQIEDLFVKTTNDKQSKKTKRERLQLAPTFKLKKEIKSIKHNILLVDDLYTTGATIHNLATILKASGFNRTIASFTLFRG